MSLEDSRLIFYFFEQQLMMLKNNKNVKIFILVKLTLNIPFLITYKANYH